MAGVKRPLFKGSVGNGVTKFIPIGIHQGCLGAHFSWPDATTNGTLTLELSSFNPEDADAETLGTADLWAASGVTLTPAFGARGSLLINLSNIRQQRARLKFISSAASVIEVYDGIQDT